MDHGDAYLEETIAKSIAVLVEWMNAEIERGATDALVGALRQKGWTVTPPEMFDAPPPDLSS